jgi:hypothetical protein
VVNSGLARGTVKPPSEAEVQEHLDGEGKRMFTRARDAQAGSIFDREYFDTQIDGHRRLLSIQRDYLMAGRNLDLINVAKLATGVIEEHLRLLADIASEMGNATTTGIAPSP